MIRWEECSGLAFDLELRVRSSISHVADRRVASVVERAVRYFQLEHILPDILTVPVEHWVDPHELWPATISRLKWNAECYWLESFDTRDLLESYLSCRNTGRCGVSP